MPIDLRRPRQLRELAAAAAIACMLGGCGPRLVRQPTPLVVIAPPAQHEVEVAEQAAQREEREQAVPSVVPDVARTMFQAEVGKYVKGDLHLGSAGFGADSKGQGVPSTQLGSGITPAPTGLWARSPKVQRPKSSRASRARLFSDVRSLQPSWRRCFARLLKKKQLPTTRLIVFSIAVDGRVSSVSFGTNTSAAAQRTPLQNCLYAVTAAKRFQPQRHPVTIRHKL